MVPSSDRVKAEIAAERARARAAERKKQEAQRAAERAVRLKKVTLLYQLGDSKEEVTIRATDEAIRKLRRAMLEGEASCILPGSLIGVRVG